MSDWIDHDGQGAPDLPPGTLVQVRFPDGATSSPKRTVEWWEENWSVSGPNRIVSYRVVQDEAKRAAHVDALDRCASFVHGK